MVAVYRLPPVPGRVHGNGLVPFYVGGHFRPIESEVDDAQNHR